MRRALTESLPKIMKANRDVILMVGDLGFSAFDDLRTRFKKQFINVGVAEQSMIGIAAGLAKEGKQVFCYSILPFAAYRTFEFIRDDACYNRIPIKVIGMGVGLDYDLGGATHFGLEDIQVMSSLPNLTILSPSDCKETSMFLEKSIKIDSPVYLRLSKNSEDAVHDRHEQIKIGKALKLREGQDVLFVTTGNVTREVLSAVSLLEHKGITSEVLEYHTIKPFDSETLQAGLKDKRLLVTVEENNGGLEKLVTSGLNLKTPVKRASIKLPDEFPHMIGHHDWLLQQCGLTSDKIAEKTIISLET